MSTNSGVQESRPLKSNLPNNFPCLCLTVSLGVWKSVDLQIPSCNPLDLGGPGSGDEAAALATGVFFSRGSVGKWCYSIPLKLPFTAHS